VAGCTVRWSCARVPHTTAPPLNVHTVLLCVCFVCHLCGTVFIVHTVELVSALSADPDHHLLLLAHGAPAAITVLARSTRAA
jgi:hypothetical protein